jgi:cytochrome c oxidase assembly protein subunit 15
VASGFDPNSVAVQPARLSLHFSFAMFLFIAVLWTALTVLRPTATPTPARALRPAAIIAALCLGLTMFAGTFVSGTHAVDVYNAATGAGMGPPANYLPLSPWWLNFFANKATILFNHQALGTLTAVAIITTATIALRGAYPPSIRDPAIAIAGLVVLQYILGVTALVSHMIDTGVAHQMNAVLLLAAIVWLLHGLRGGGLRRPA